MFAFGRKKSARLGLDIGSTAIKLVELSQARGTSFSAIHVENYAIEPLPPNAVVEKKIANVQAVGATIRKAVARSGTKVKRAATALSGSAVMTKVIPMSATLSDAEMEAQIQLESDQYIPYPIEEVNTDFGVLGPSDSGGNLVDVLLAASRRENVDDRVAALEIGGLSAAIIDVEAYTMVSACTLLSDAGMDRTVAIADIGAATTTLHVLHEGQTVYTREQGFGGHQLIEEVQQHYGMDRDQALQQVIEDNLPDSYATEILDPFKEALAQQISRALQFFYSTGTFNRVDRIVLAGGVAGTRGIGALLEERLGIPTAVANPFSRMSLSSKVGSAALNRDAPAMMIAAGLALRGFD
ncbi:pilus assembly protein PilM [Candidatus Thiosymbion oneisti]|uniref:pilus assembly protein PilM n=1 Tax=Candidatus Thiosymbion oneisti TaxID=589554 RepID=UPI000AB76C6B|nr:pilus assembly protein PilM [Candidatus Thiosymbion oneisti]